MKTEKSTRKKEYDSWKVCSYFPLLVKMNHYFVWELSEKKINCKYCFLFPPFYPVLAPMKKVAMKNKLNFLKQYPQKQSLHSPQPANLEVNLGSLILIRCQSFWTKRMRQIFKVWLICPCTQSQYFLLFGKLLYSAKMERCCFAWAGFESLILKPRACNFSLLCLTKPSCVLVPVNKPGLFLGSLWSKNKEK